MGFHTSAGSVVDDKSGCSVRALSLVESGFGRIVATSFIHCSSGAWAWPLGFASSRDSSFSKRARILLPLGEFSIPLHDKRGK